MRLTRLGNLLLAGALALGCTTSAKRDPKVGVVESKQKFASSALVHPDWQGVAHEDAVKKGLDWLISVQGDDGGWGQDGGSNATSRQGVHMESSGNDVANTAMAVLAMLKAGSTPTTGDYAQPMRKAVEFILGHVEKAPEEGLSITDRQGTQIQRKLGPNIDTFLASMVLSEVDGLMGDEKLDARVRAALQKVVTKIEKNQGQDGSWNAGGGWAPVIGTSMASRGLARAKDKGVAVDGDVLAKVEEYTKSNFDAKSGGFSTGGAAGVELYQAAQALEQGTRTTADREENAEMNSAAAGKLAEARFVSGFGSMGGEEFVSYLNISDSLARSGGEAWTGWNGKVHDHLVKLQNQDGTWAGHHCITGRVACTSAAIMTLLAERALPRG